MAHISGIANETIKAEIEEFLERPEEIERNVELFNRASPAMQDIAAALPGHLVEFHRFPDCGHGAYRDCPGEAIPLIRRFIRT